MLSEDCPQKKLFAYFRENISKGELVQLDQFDQWSVVFSYPSVVIDCQKDQLNQYLFDICWQWRTWHPDSIYLLTISIY